MIPKFKGCCDPRELPKPQNFVALLRASIALAKERKRETKRR